MPVCVREPKDSFSHDEIHLLDSSVQAGVLFTFRLSHRAEAMRLWLSKIFQFSVSHLACRVVCSPGGTLFTESGEGGVERRMCPGIYLTSNVIATGLEV